MEAQAKRKDEYEELAPQINGLLDGEPDFIANAANLVSVLHNTFHFFWTGIYIVRENELVLGPFQGPTACTRIAFGKGVCGHTWKKAKTTIVPNVNQFPGHIACTEGSRSEIVVPLIDLSRQVRGVLDIDSANFDGFGVTDQKYLEQFCAWLQPTMPK